MMEIPHVQNTRHDSPLGNRERVRSKALSAHPGAERLHASKSSPLYEIDAQVAAVAFISGILVKSEKQAKTLHSWRSNRPATSGSVPVSGEAPRDTALPSIALTQMNQNPQGVRMAPPSPMLRDTEKRGHDRDRSRKSIVLPYRAQQEQTTAHPEPAPDRHPWFWPPARAKSHGTRPQRFRRPLDSRVKYVANPNPHRYAPQPVG